MKTLLIKNVKHLVTCDTDDRVLNGVNVLVQDGIIVRIGQEDMTADDVIDASHMVMYPGLINTHHHLYQTFSRNLPQVQNMELFPWLKTLYEIWKNVNENVAYYSSLTGMGELLKNGCTTCLDHHYVFPKGHNKGILDAQFAAADALGIRFHATRGSMDLSVKDGGLPPDSVVQTVDEILSDCEEAVKKFHDPNPYAMHQVALASCIRSGYEEILIDFGPVRQEIRAEWFRCQIRILTASLSEWKLEAFLEFLAEEEELGKGWNCMAAFGSKAIRHEIEKQFRIPIEKIPFSEDVFQVDKTAMAWFGKRFP